MTIILTMVQRVLHFNLLRNTDAGLILLWQDFVKYSCMAHLNGNATKLSLEHLLPPETQAYSKTVPVLKDYRFQLWH